jgi:uncharacterized protein
MIRRDLRDKLIQLFTKFPAIAILGPRQSGKTTLAREVFPHLKYINLEDLSVRQHAREDPKDFLEKNAQGLILDEIQNVPELLSYLQVYIDQQDKPGLYVLTGSHQILLNEKNSQSLAGRVAINTLLPFSYQEIKQQTSNNINEIIFNGFYPRLFRYEITPADFYPSYIQTYIEKDIRQLTNVSDLGLFQKFLKLCAGRVGQLLNLSSLANDCGISHVTARKWLSILEMSFIVYLLKPHHKNFNKRLVKTPKLYFYDTGVACNLLGIQSLDQLDSHYARGALFENFIILEYIKNNYNQGRIPNCYFWRDKLGHEIDMLLDKEQSLIPIEIKSGKTINQSFFKNLEYWNKISGLENNNYLIYSGAENQCRHKTKILNWQCMESLWNDYSS